MPKINATVPTEPDSVPVMEPVVSEPNPNIAPVDLPDPNPNVAPVKPDPVYPHTRIPVPNPLFSPSMPTKPVMPVDR